MIQLPEDQREREALLRSLASGRNETGLSALIAFLRKQQSALDTALRREKGLTMKRTQGAAQAVHDILAMCDDADATISAMTAARSRGESGRDRF